MYSLTSFGTEGDVLHGDPAIALDEGCLNVGDVNGGVDGLPDVHHQLGAEESVLSSEDINLDKGVGSSYSVVPPTLASLAHWVKVDPPLGPRAFHAFSPNASRQLHILITNFIL